MDDQTAIPGRRAAPAEVWDTVKADYLAGLSGPDCCRRHGVTLSALRDRAARQGWRRADQPWVPPHELDPWDEGRILEERIGGDLDQIEWSELSHVAEGRMMRAVLRGEAAEVLRWNKVLEILEAREAGLRRWAEEEEVRKFHLRQRAPDLAAAEAEPDSTDYPDFDFEPDLEDRGPVRGFIVTPDGGLAPWAAKPVSSLSRSDGEVDASSSRADGGGDRLSTGEHPPGLTSHTVSPPPSRREAAPRHLPTAAQQGGEPNHPFGLPVAGSVAVSPELLDPSDPAGSVAG